MCGISGIIRFDNEIIDKQELRAFNDSLSHRGPDNGNVYVSENYKVGLGHRRLSIIDLDDSANQPMISADKRYVLTFNGEIYNYIELKKELIQLGHTFITQSDSEVILNSYKEWGVDCLRRFNGMWAFAIWDCAKHRLFAARDRFGVKPFYYVKKNNYFLFASEQKAFKHFSKFDYSIDASLANYAVHNISIYEAQRKCIYSEVLKLLPGEYLLVDSTGNFLIEKWWDLQSEILNTSFELEKSIELFLDSCRIRTRSDVDIAFSLSGGMDSSTVTTYSNQFVKSRSRAFIGSFKGTSFDEYELAKLVANNLALDYQRVEINSDDLMAELNRCMIQFEDISTEPPIGQWMVYKAMNEAGFKVSIEGHAGDELLGGYVNHVQAHLGDCILTQNNYSELIKTILLTHEMRSITGYGNSSLGATIRGSTETIKGSEQSFVFSRYFDTSPTDISYGSTKTLNSEDSLLNINLFNDFNFFTLPSILRNYDKLSMGNSVEVRSPFLDWRFVLQAFLMPSDCKIKDGKTKYFLREILKQVPAEVRNNKCKLGFNIPMTNWLKSKNKELITDFVNQTNFLESSLFDGRRFREDICTYMSNGKWREVSNLWRLISLHIIDQGCKL